MNTFTAKQITEILQKDDPNLNLRTIRYYTQIGMVPPLELFGNKRVYTEKHLSYFRAIVTLARTGKTLASVQETLQDLSLEEIDKIGDQITLFQSNKIIENETVRVNDDVFITLSPRISAELRQRVIDSVSNVLKGDGNSC